MKDLFGTMLSFQRQIKDMERHPERYGGPFDDYAKQASAWLRAEAEGEALLKLQTMNRAEAFTYLHHNPPTPMAILWLINEAKRLGISERASAGAKAKNLKAIEHARIAWKEAKAANPKINKRTFAGALALDLARPPWRTHVLPETIAYDWLKGH